MQNLHDKWAELADGTSLVLHQLWANDEVAFVMVDDKHKAGRYQVITDNGKGEIAYRFKDFSQAFDVWNKTINQYLERQPA